MSQLPSMKSLLSKQQRQCSRQERKRLQQLLSFERAARQKGFCRIAGIDEAGRGPLAGPVVAAACILPEGWILEGIDDSKKLSRPTRQRIFKHVTNDPQICYSVGIVSAEIIDEINIFQATVQAMLAAVQQLGTPPDYLLVDGMRLPYADCPVEKIIKGDALSLSIATASIIAKETRDLLMEEMHLQWPMYGFDRHKGYGTEQHLEAIRQHGLCPIHRRSFRTSRACLLEG
jgi:ribonuclease HII